MVEPAPKKRKVGAPHGPKITDPRFANIQSDPRYRLPGKKNKVKLDKRFSRALKDEDFNRHAKVDRYGRPLETESEHKRLKRKYEFEDESGSDEPDDDAEVQRELKRVGGDNTRDLLREGKEVDEDSSSDSSSDEDEEEDVEEAELAPQTKNEVLTGEVSSRLAVVNLDWDNIRAEDLMAVFSSFLSGGGKLLNVAVYPSEFGKERMQREEMEGPPKEIFAGESGPDRGDDEFEDFGSGTEDEDEDDDEALKEKLIGPDDGGTDFDSAALRRYQLDRLRYFYAILTFSSPAAAKHIYDAVDGTEYLSTANFFDLRFVPDETDFSSDTPREECEGVSSSYKPNEFVTDALQHSKVKLTWDAEDTSRKEAAAQAFRSKDIRDLDDVDLAAYIGSDSSDSDPDVDGNADDPTADSTSKRESERQKMRSLLGLGPEPVVSSKSKKERAPVGNVEITFSAGLSSNDPDKKRSVFENSPEPDETTIEKYVRKEKERKARRREKAKAAREGQPTEDTIETGAAAAADDDTNKVEADGEDQGFDDPFFANPSDPSTAQAAASEKKKVRKEERLKKRREREAEEEAERKQRAQLELLMADDQGENSGKGAAAVRHFDMRDVEKAEKAARRKAKQKKNKGNKDSLDHPDQQADAAGGDGAASFEMDTADPRFAGRLFGNHEFAIDPSNPRYKGTKGMQALLEEGRRRKGRRGSDDGNGDAARSEKPAKRRDDDQKSKKSKKQKDTAREEEEGFDGATAAADDVKSLVEKIKRRKA